MESGEPVFYFSEVSRQEGVGIEEIYGNILTGAWKGTREWILRILYWGLILPYLTKHQSVFWKNAGVQSQLSAPCFLTLRPFVGHEATRTRRTARG